MDNVLGTLFVRTMMLEQIATALFQWATVEPANHQDLTGTASSGVRRVLLLQCMVSPSHVLPGAAPALTTLLSVVIVLTPSP